LVNRVPLPLCRTQVRHALPSAVRRELAEKILVAQLDLFPTFCGSEWLIIAIIGSCLEPNEYRPRLRNLFI